MNPKEELGTFFDFIWENETGFVYLPTKDSNGLWKKSFYKWPEHREYVIDHVLINSDAEKDVYFSPVIWNKPELSKSTIKGSNVLWADFDGNAPDWFDSSLQNLPGPPSLVIQSSTESHQHVYWKLDVLQTDITNLENTNRAIAYSQSADTSGWDAEQILRPPFSTNYKHVLPVLLHSRTETNYSFQSFQTFEPIRQIIDEAIDESNLPTIIEVIAKYNWRQDSLQLIETTSTDINRSGALARIAYDAAELGAVAEEIYSVLIYLDNKLGKFKHRSDRKKRLTDLVNIALYKYPHAVEGTSFDGLLKPTATEVDEKYVFGFNDFLLQDFNIDWAIKDLMPANGIGLVFSPPNVGKTQFLTQMGIHHGLGQPFVGYQFSTACRGIIFSLEMGKFGFHRLMATISKDYTVAEKELLNNNVLIIPAGEPMPLSIGKINAFFESILEKYKPQWVYIDSLVKVITGKLTDDEAVLELFNYLAVMRNKHNFYCWLIHHNRKTQGDNKQPKHLDDAYGSRYLTSEPDAIISLWEQTKGSGEITVTEVKNRYMEIRPEFTVYRTPNLNFSMTPLQGLIRNDPVAQRIAFTQTLSGPTNKPGKFGDLG